MGDIVVGNEFYQHDMDASPIIPRHEIPLPGKYEIAGDAGVLTRLRVVACSLSKLIWRKW